VVRQRSVLDGRAKDYDTGQRWRLVFGEPMSEPTEETNTQAIIRMIGERTGGDYSPEAVCKLLDDMAAEDEAEWKRIQEKHDETC